MPLQLNIEGELNEAAARYLQQFSGLEIRAVPGAPTLCIEHHPHHPAYLEEFDQLPPGEITICERGDLDRLYARGGILDLPLDSPDTVLHRCDLEGTGLPVELLNLAVSRIFALQGALVLHAVGFELSGEHVVALGQSGVGKSTLAAAVLAAGGRIVSDDRLVLAASKTGLEMRSLRLHLAFREGGYNLLPSKFVRQLEYLETPVPRWVLDMSSLGDRYLRVGEVSQIWILEPGSRRPHSSRVAKAAAGQVLSRLISCSSPFFFSKRRSLERLSLGPVVAAVAQEPTAVRIALGSALCSEPAGELARVFERARRL